jgi:hypothetical protein
MLSIQPELGLLVYVERHATSVFESGEISAKYLNASFNRDSSVYTKKVIYHGCLNLSLCRQVEVLKVATTTLTKHGAWRSDALRGGC